MNCSLSLTAAAVATLVSVPAFAGNVTAQQTCALMAEHVITILESRDWKEEAATDIERLDAFQSAQQAIIDREVAASAAQMKMPVEQVQEMVDQQGAMLTSTIEGRFGTEKLYRDYAVSLLNCAKATPNDLGSSPADFVATLEQIGAWAQAGR